MNPLLGAVFLGLINGGFYIYEKTNEAIIVVEGAVADKARKLKGCVLAHRADSKRLRAIEVCDFSSDDQRG
ncbi:hypothetical protein L873DRAFT_1801980 [Choiromyces venosus 120613-1]|uniref:Uncharacterized protein n=1 Tax=Choiromyces venosus 120613-1 TaxID=1336337 RepID=A0A3N4JZQ6_9PEZI|nr:hypothetical protein L873DRAFT_1801980 [Choiromyces venosus 120613-1]